MSVVSRLGASWVAGRPKVSSTMLCAVTLFLSGLAVCLMPYWGTFLGQVFLMVIYGLMVCKSSPPIFVTNLKMRFFSYLRTVFFPSAPFFSLTSIIICDILDLEALTNAYGIVTMVRGIASTVGSPVAGN